MNLSKAKQIVREVLGDKNVYNRFLQKANIKTTGGDYSKNQINPLIKLGFNNLPDTRADVNWSNRKNIPLPTINGEDSTTSMFSKQEIENWIKEFTERYGEAPQFNVENGHVKVVNPVFVEKQNKYIEGKSSELSKYKSKD